jgi:transposase
MSLKPQAVCPVPEETVRVARAAFPKGSVYLKMRDLFGTFFEDEAFSDLFSSRGQPAETPWRLALVTVMQFAEKLSDRQAAEAVRARIDWKYALSLELTDQGFDYSVLSQFRTRLLAGSVEHYLLEKMLAVFQEKGLLKPRGKQRTDSTHVLAHIRILNRLSCVGEAMRAALNTLAQTAPTWLRMHLQPEWPERYGPRFEEHRLPAAPSQQQELALCIGVDGYTLLTALDDPATPQWLPNLPILQTFRRIWVQHYTRQEDQVIFREEKDTPPAALRIHSIYEPDARYSTKRTTTWTGYKVHVTQTCEEDAPHLITHVETTPATTLDAAAIEDIHGTLEQKKRLPAMHLVDTGYVDAERLVQSRARGVDLYGPVREDGGWQARENAGFAQSDFRIDWSAQQAHCPRGKVSTVWKTSRDRHGKDVLHVEFDRRECDACPCRSSCTRSRTSGRELTLRLEEQHQAIQSARERQSRPEFKAQYALRAGIEGTLSQGLRGFALRRCRYRGQDKTHLQHLATAAAMNLVRALAWVMEIPRESKRVSPLMRLVQPA